MIDISLHHGDCLEVMKQIPDGSVDMVLCDPPYGILHCKWDKKLPQEALWSEYRRIASPKCAIVIFSNEPFTSEIIVANKQFFKYRLNWDKKIPSGFCYALKRPMSQIEDICVFSANGNPITYNPQMIKRDKPIHAGGNNCQSGSHFGFKCRGIGKKYDKVYEYKNPTTLICFDKVRKHSLHPTQKPIALLSYLIRTYSNKGDIILDNCMGSGSTGVACIETERNFIGIEKEDKYFNIAKERIAKAQTLPKQQELEL